jgi:hypothetical protein
MPRYRLILDEIQAHPSGNTTSDLQLHMKFEGDDGLISRIHSAIADEIINWQNSQKNTNKS